MSYECLDEFDGFNCFPDIIVSKYKLEFQTKVISFNLKLMGCFDDAVNYLKGINVSLF